MMGVVVVVMLTVVGSIETDDVMMMILIANDDVLIDVCMHSISLSDGWTTWDLEHSL